MTMTPSPSQLQPTTSSCRIESLFVLSVDGSEGGDEPFRRVYGSDQKSDEEIMQDALALRYTFKLSFTMFDNDSTALGGTLSTGRDDHAHLLKLKCSEQIISVAFTTIGERI